MSDNLMSAISGFLSNAWSFFTETNIPGTEISFAVLFIGLALIPIGFQFLSIMVGHNIGETGEVGGEDYGHWVRRGKNAKISDKRKNDVR